MTPGIWNSWPVTALLAGCLAACFVGSGCGSKELEDLKAQATDSLNKAKQSVADAKQTVEKTAQNLPGDVAALAQGEIKLMLDAPVSSATCSARFTPPTGGRPGVLQIGTSVNSGPQSFPAVYLHAPTEIATLAALPGQTVHGQLFIAKGENQGHYQSADGKPVAVQIVKIENNVITCQLQNAELIRLDEAQPAAAPQLVSGQLVGAIRP